MLPRRILFTVAVLLCVCPGLLSGPVAAEGEGGRSVVKTYAGGTFVPPETGCTYDGRVVDPDGEEVEPVAEPVEAYQQACFAVLPGEATYSIETKDEGPFPAKGWYIFTDAEGAWLDGRTHWYCGSTQGLLPEGAATMLLFVERAHAGCDKWGIPPTMGATVGTVTVTFE